MRIQSYKMFALIGLITAMTIQQSQAAGTIAIDVSGPSDCHEGEMAKCIVEAAKGVFVRQGIPVEPSFNQWRTIANAIEENWKPQKGDYKINVTHYQYPYAYTTMSIWAISPNTEASEVKQKAEGVRIEGRNRFLGTNLPWARNAGIDFYYIR